MLVKLQKSGSSHINPPKITNCYDYSLSLLKETKNDTSLLSYCEGFTTTSDEIDNSKFEQAIDLSRKNDIVVVFAGLPDSFESEGFDRKHIHLPECQNKLISEIAKVNKNVVIVLHKGSVVDMPWSGDVKAIVELYLCGEAVGEATANVLFGIVNPSGHLSESFPIRLQDNPSYLDFPGFDNEVHYQEGLFVGYRYYDKKEMNVLFPFGHGLSYTTFEYSNIRTEKNDFNDNDEKIFVYVDIKKSGCVGGKTVAQLYVSDKTNSVLRPVKELKAFQKVHLEPGEVKTIKFHLNKRSFAWWNPKIQDWFVSSGEYEIIIGQSSRDENELRLKLTIRSTNKWMKKVDMNTTVGELLQNPITKPIILDIFSRIPGFNKTPNQNDQDAKARLDMALASPLRMLLMAFPKKETVTHIIDSANQLIEEDANKSV